MKQRLTLIGLLGIVTLCLPAAWPSASAQEPEPVKRVRVDLGLGTWISVGDTRWSHDASSQLPLGNPTSKLVYEDHSTNVAEFTAKLSVGPRWFGRLNLGGTGIGGGRLTDDDFLTPDGGRPSSRTHSDIGGTNMWFVNADAGFRMLTFPNNRGNLDGVIGFQYWRQRHEAFGVRQVACSPAGATIDFNNPNTPGPDPLCIPGFQSLNSSTLAVTNASTWYSLRTGVQTDYRLARWLSINGSIVFKPINFFTNEDTHHLRVPSEFQDPSFTMLGYGFGADADIGARVYFTRSLSAQVGYRVFWNRMIDGTWKNHLADGRSFSFPLVEMESLRHGLTGGINYSF